jgi:hypothetical protein
VPTAASQPPSRSEQRSAPSPQARAATAKPRQGTALGPRAHAAPRTLAGVRNRPIAGSCAARQRAGPMPALMARTRSRRARWRRRWPARSRSARRR